MQTDQTAIDPSSGPGAAWMARMMEEALRLAREARSAGEVPVGAVLVGGGEIIGRGANAPIGSGDPTAHAEILALREGAARAGNYRLTGTILVVTLEPCLMCLGAMLHARVGTLVFGAADARLGATSLLRDAASVPGGLNHRIEIVGGVSAGACASLLTEFFRERRAEGADDAVVPPRSSNVARALSTCSNLVCGEVPKWS